MSYEFGKLVFTPVVKELQERYGSRRQYAKRENSAFQQDGLGPAEEDFLHAADSFYMSTVGATGWPYVQHRGGPQGFLKVIDPHTIAFADFRGNKQFISTGNLITEDKVALILMDYPNQARLKILGHVEIFEGAAAAPWIEKLSAPEYNAVVERVFVIHVSAFDWNCQQHITPRFTREQIRTALAPFEEKMQALQTENEKLKAIVRASASSKQVSDEVQITG